MYKCELDDSVCDFGSYSLKKLRDHMYENHGQNSYIPYHCNMCDKKCLMLEELSHHMNEFHDQNLIQFQCATCPMGFYEKTSYFVHQKLHDSVSNINTGCIISKRLI